MSSYGSACIPGKRSQSVLCGTFNPFFPRKLLLLRSPLAALYLGPYGAAQEVGAILPDVEDRVHPRQRSVRESRGHLLEILPLPAHGGRLA
jgi:hypothetical protein